MSSFREVSLYCNLLRSVTQKILDSSSIIVVGTDLGMDKVIDVQRNSVSITCTHMYKDETGNTWEKLQHHLCPLATARMLPGGEDTVLEPTRGSNEK